MKRLALAPLVVALAAGCGGEPPLAKVDGVAIDQQDLEAWLKLRGYGGEISEQARQAALQELITTTLLARHARALDLPDELAAELALVRRQHLADAALARALESGLDGQAAPLDDAAVEQAYQARRDEFALTEVRARHIVVENEQKALALIVQLDGGADFAEVAKRHSEDETAKRGGDLGWFEPRRMTPAFAKAVETLPAGTHTKTPIRSPAGWHLVKVEGRRQLPSPTLEELGPQLKGLLRAERIASIVEQLESKYPVED